MTGTESASADPFAQVPESVRFAAAPPRLPGVFR